jgi:uncharacterized protein YqgV (UPF0045/DUF77 family)
MLTKDLLYHTPKETTLNENLTESLRLIQYVTKYCNEKQREIEKNLRIRYLMKYLKIKV